MPISPFNWTKALQEVSQIKVKSVTDPLFRFSLVALLIGAALSPFDVHFLVLAFIFCSSGLLLLLGIAFYIYFALKDPNFLRSETYQYQVKSLEAMGDKSNALPASTVNQMIDITDPSPKELEDKEEKNGED